MTERSKANKVKQKRKKERKKQVEQSHEKQKRKSESNQREQATMREWLFCSFVFTNLLKGIDHGIDGSCIQSIKLDENDGERARPALCDARDPRHEDGLHHIVLEIRHKDQEEDGQEQAQDEQGRRN